MLQKSKETQTIYPNTSQLVTFNLLDNRELLYYTGLSRNKFLSLCDLIKTKWVYIVGSGSFKGRAITNNII